MFAGENPGDLPGREGALRREAEASGICAGFEAIYCRRSNITANTDIVGEKKVLPDPMYGARAQAILPPALYVRFFRPETAASRQRNGSGER